MLYFSIILSNNSQNASIFEILFDLEHDCSVHLSKRSMLCSSTTSQSWRSMISIRFQKLPLAFRHQLSIKKRARSFSISRSFADGMASKRSAPLTSTQSPLQFGILLDDIGQNEDSIDESLKSPKSTKKRVIKHEIEIQRRKKIGLANKGKVPWNKGRQHSPGMFQFYFSISFKFFIDIISLHIETRERIRRRTIEAMSDPKVSP